MAADIAGYVEPIEARYRVAHRSRGRLRVILTDHFPGDAMEFAASLALHPAVTEVRWVPAARSLTVRHDPRQSAASILACTRRARPRVVVVEDATLRLPAEDILSAIPRFGMPGIMINLAMRVLAPPPARVLRRA